jgi:hypothetical protein
VASGAHAKGRTVCEYTEKGRPQFFPKNLGYFWHSGNFQVGLGWSRYLYIYIHIFKIINILHIHTYVFIYIHTYIYNHIFTEFISPSKAGNKSFLKDISMLWCNPAKLATG